MEDTTLIIFLKILSFFSCLFICGIIIIRRLTEEKRALILIPSGAILGIALYVFIINLIAHVIKGIPGFYISLAIEICIATLIKIYISIQPMEFPKGGNRILAYILLLLWALFLYKIVDTNELSGDVIYHYNLATLFSRGDYPMHTPWQPEYVMNYHYGGAEFLGAARSITGAPYEFLQRILALFMLVSWSQILTWLLIKKVPNKISSILIISIPSFIGLISLGGFMITWPFPPFSINMGGNLFHWLGQLPTLNTAETSYGSPAVLGMMIVFLHSFLSISFFFSLVTLLILPKKGKLILLSSFIFILLSSIALTNEAIFIPILPAVILVSFFTVFNKSIPRSLIFVILTILIVCVQGGIITETLFNRQGSSSFQIFPEGRQSFAFLTKYFHSFDNLPQYQPFKWVHPGIIWQLSLLLILAVFSRFSNFFTDPKDKLKFQATLWLFCISSIISAVAFRAIVPKIFPENGSRFLIFSYYLSGLGITFYIVNWWILSNKRRIILRFVIIWILIFSCIPSLFAMFPRGTNNHLIIQTEADLPSTFNWIKSNLSINERIMVLTQPNVGTIANNDLVVRIGALTPMWGLTPRVENVFDMSPLYADAYFTLNPDTLNKLKIDYLIIGKNYLPQLSIERKPDLTNNSYFQPVFTDPESGETIFKVTPEYLSKGKNLRGTLTELEQIAPKNGTFFIEYVPNISGNMFRALLVLLFDRDVHHIEGASGYNGSIDVEFVSKNNPIEGYDYLILGTETNPKDICHCEASLLWTGLGNGLKLWKTK